MANPKGKEQCNAVTLKNGKQVLNPEPKKAKESNISEGEVQEQQNLSIKEDELNSQKDEKSQRIRMQEMGRMNRKAQKLGSRKERNKRNLKFGTSRIYLGHLFHIH